jgi:urate oxidase
MKTAIVAIVVLFSVVSANAQQLDTPRIYIEPSETVNSTNTKDKGKHIDFGAALTAALLKKQVPVTVVTDQGKSQWTIRSVSSQKEDSTGTKVTKILAFGAFAGSFTQFEGTIQVVENDSTAVLFAYNVKKSNFQSAAEAFAKHFKNHLAKQR